jgi:hypothetical protein
MVVVVVVVMVSVNGILRTEFDLYFDVKCCSGLDLYFAVEFGERRCLRITVEHFNRYIPTDKIEQ